MKSPISKNFNNFLISLQKIKSLDKKKCVTLQIFYDLFKIRESQWQHKLKFKRRVDYSTSEIFQDLIAHYLKRILPKNYEIILEYKQNKLRPDILIKKNNKNHSIIEVKTTIGWNRWLVEENNYMTRLKKLKKEFNVPLKRIFYIFESSRNVNEEFAKKFRNIKRKKKIHRHIFPLFEYTADPFYISKKQKIKGHKKYTDKEILKFYKEYKLTNFYEIVKKIK